MLAKIISKEKEYYSVVFALIDSGWYMKAIVFNDEIDEFCIVNLYETNPLVRKVFICDADKTGWITYNRKEGNIFKKETSVSGVEWLVADFENIKSIIKGETVVYDIIKKAKECNQHKDISEWKLIEDNDDIESLLTLALDFHDSYISKIEYFSENEYDEPSMFKVTFNGAWDASIEMIFQRDILIHFSTDDNCTKEIFGASCFFENGFIYWVDDDSVTSASKISLDNIFFKARSLKWKFSTK